MCVSARPSEMGGGLLFYQLTKLMEIESVKTDSEEVRITTKSKTYVFARTGFQGTSTGASVSLDELKELKELTKDVKGDTKIILGLTWHDYQLL